MKKLLLIGLIFLTACLSPSGGGSEPLQPTITPEATATRVTPTEGPATITPTFTPPPTATTAPPERFFTEEFDVVPGTWSTLYASGGSDRVEVLNENSKLTFEIYSPVTWIYTIYGAFEYTNVRIETRVESLGSEVNALGLVCHYDEQQGWYEFNISNDGSYFVLHGQWLADGIASYTPITDGASDQIGRGNSVNELGLGCHEDTLQLYINGNLIRNLNVEHIGLTGGKVGLSLGTFEEVPVILSFDWVRVSEP